MIPPFLPTSNLVYATIPSCLDSCSSLIAGLSALIIAPHLQLICRRTASVSFVTAKGHHFTCLFSTLQCPFISLKGIVKVFRMAYMALRELISLSFLTSSCTTLPLTLSAPARTKWLLRHHQAPPTSRP